MNKPHYKQPVTATNIETALQFYYEQKGLKYALKRTSALIDVTTDILDNHEEIKSMYDIEGALDGNLLLVHNVLKVLKIRTEPTTTLRYTLALSYPLWRKSFIHKYYTGKTVIAMEKAKAKELPSVNH